MDGPLYGGSWGPWYIKGNAGAITSSTIVGTAPTQKNFTFILKLTAANRMNVTITDGTTTENFYDVHLNTSNAITDYSIYHEDDWNGNGSNRDALWGFGTANEQHSLTATSVLDIGRSNSSYTIASAIINSFPAMQQPAL
jgi:hypothetical protein